MKAKSRTPIGPSQNFYKYKILTQNLIQDKKKKLKKNWNPNSQKKWKLDT
jgi:hypothetical protein